MVMGSIINQLNERNWMPGVSVFFTTILHFDIYVPLLERCFDLLLDRVRIATGTV